MEEIVGDVRDLAAARDLVAGADVVVHAAAALPIQAAANAIRSVNVDGTATVLAAALEAGVRRAIFISSTAVYGVPERHPIREDDPLVGVGAYGGSKIEAEAVCRAFELRGLETVIVRPKTFLGPERLGVFEILFDWIREGRRIPILGDGSNRYQLLAVDDLVEAVVRCFGAPVAGQALNVGAARFGSVRDDLGVLCAHAGSGSRLLPVPARPAELALRGLELAPAFAARGVALPNRSSGLVRGDRPGAGAARLGAAHVERGGSVRDVRLVPRAPGSARRRRRNAPGAVGPARARPAQAAGVTVCGGRGPGHVAQGHVQPQRLYIESNHSPPLQGQSAAARQRPARTGFSQTYLHAPPRYSSLSITR